MKPQELYSAINQIDDDLIESAMFIKPLQKIIPFRRYAAFAACLCIMIVGIILVNNLSGTRIYINEVPGVIMKSVDVDMMKRHLSQEEIKDYFDEFILPSHLSSKLMLDERSDYIFLINDNNSIYDDATIFTYRYKDQVVEVQLSKIGLQYGDIFNDGTEKKASQIENQEIMIGKYIDYKVGEEIVEIEKFVAEYKHQNIYIHITSEGVDEEEFIDILRQLIYLNVDE